MVSENHDNAVALTSSNVGPNHDHRGKFAPGNKAAVGHKHPIARQVRALKETILTAATPERVRKIVEAMIVKAVNDKDVAAARVVLEYAVGPSNKVDVNIGDGSSFQIVVVPAEDGLRSPKPLSESVSVSDSLTCEIEAASGTQGGQQTVPKPAEEGGDCDR
ncbi:MAG: hypothetical protein AAF711_04965 [Planctomycetota bacterium]